MIVAVEAGDRSLRGGKWPLAERLDGHYGWIFEHAVVEDDGVGALLIESGRIGCDLGELFVEGEVRSCARELVEDAVFAVVLKDGDGLGGGVDGADGASEGVHHLLGSCQNRQADTQRPNEDRQEQGFPQIPHNFSYRVFRNFSIQSRKKTFKSDL